MPKGKLKIAKADAKKYKVAAQMENIKLGATKLVGDTLITEVTFADIQNVHNAAAAMAGYKGDEFDEPSEEKGDKGKK